MIHISKPITTSYYTLHGACGCNNPCTQQGNARRFTFRLLSY